MSAPRPPMMLVAFLLVAGLGLAWLLAKERTEEAQVGNIAIATGTIASQHDGGGSRAAAPEIGEPVVAAPESTVGPAAQVFNAGGDLHALAVAHLAAAEAGDAESQWALHFALRFCEHHLTYLPTRESLTRMDERLRASTLGNPRTRALTEREFQMCDGFRSDPIARFGPSETWFQAALDAGHPLAKAEFATSLALAWRDLHRGDAASRARVARGEAGMPIDHFHRVIASEAIIGQGLDADGIAQRMRALTLDALATDRADAFMAVALNGAQSLATELRQYESGDDDDSWLLNRAALATLACQRGFPCTEQAFWVQALDMYSTRPLARDGQTLMMDSQPAALRAALPERIEQLAEAFAAARWDAYWPEAGAR